MKNRSQHKTIALLVCVIGTAVSLFIVFGLIEHFVNKAENAFLEETAVSVPDTTGGQIYYKDTWYIPRESIRTLLVLGIDKQSPASSSDAAAEERQASEQVDFLALLVMDEEQESFRILHLNRDTMADILQTDIAGVEYGTFKGQLALAHAYGSSDGARCRNTVRAVENLLYNVEIDHYMSLTMDAVAILNDSVGGVPLPLLDNFTGIDPSYTRGTVVTLTGEQALTYVRARSELEDSSNLSRMERQRQYIGALFEAFIASEKNAAEDSLETLLRINEYMVSDCTAEQLSSLTETLSGYTYRGILTLAGEAVTGEEYVEFYLDEAEAQKTVVELFYEPLD